MSDTPLISIVMPTYNAALYLKESIESVICQSFSDFEFLILDDGSTDNSVDIINSYEDTRIKLYINQHNYIVNLNKGLSLANGNYIAIMHADDIMYKDRLKVQFEFMSTNMHIDICGTWMQELGNIINGNIESVTTHGSIISDMLLYNPISHPTVMMKREVLQRFPLKDNAYQLYEKDYISVEDYKLWTEIAKKGGRFSVIPQFLMYYRTNNPTRISVIHQNVMYKLGRRVQIEYLEYIMDSIVETNNEFYDLLDHAIELYNNKTIALDLLIAIVHAIYKNAFIQNKIS